MLGLGLGLSNNSQSGGGVPVVYASWTLNTPVTSVNQWTRIAAYDGGDILSTDNTGIKVLRYNTGTKQFAPVGNTYEAGVGVDNTKDCAKAGTGLAWYLRGTGLSLLSWDGTDFTLVDSISVSGSSYQTITDMGDGYVCYISGTEITMYRNNGGTVEKVGNSGTLVGGNYKNGAGITNDTVIISDSASDTAYAWKFDGTDWAKYSTSDYSLTAALSGQYIGCKLTSTHALVWDGGANVRAVYLNGTTVEGQGTAVTITGASSWPRDCCALSPTLAACVSYGGTEIRTIEATLA